MLPFSGTYIITQGDRNGPVTHWCDAVHSYNYVNCGAIDFAMVQGTYILAANDGTIIYQGSDNPTGTGFGYYILLRHSNGITSAYAHLSSFENGGCNEYMSCNISVKKGDVIGYSGHSGSGTANHLHFGMTKQTSDGHYQPLNILYLNGLSWNGSPTNPDWQNNRYGTGTNEWVWACQADVEGMDCNSDTTPPSGSWTNPSNGQTISSRSVTLNVNASDNSGGSGVKEVRFSAKWDGVWRGIGTASSSPYSISWDMCSSGVPNGDVELGFEVWDNANNKWIYSEHYSNIHINKSYTCTTGTDTTPPTAYWTSPGNGQTISSQSVTLSVNASDNSGGSGVREVRWSAKWNNQWSGIGTDNTSPYSINWDMCASGVPNGDVELGMEVWDNANNVWIYSQHYTNYHINKNYTCNTSTGGWETWGWQNKYLAGYENWHGTMTWNNDYPYIWWDFGSGGPFTGWGGDEFSLRMQKNVSFPRRRYSFHTEHDDGVKVYIDGNLMIDAWWDGNGGHDAGRNVSQGYHQIKVEFFTKTQAMPNCMYSGMVRVTRSLITTHRMVSSLLPEIILPPHTHR